MILDILASGRKHLTPHPRGMEVALRSSYENTIRVSNGFLIWLKGNFLGTPHGYKIEVIYEY